MMKKFLLLGILASSSAHGALTLFVNTATKTLSWSGDATSSAVQVGAQFGQTNVGITTAISNTYNGGIFATSAVSSGPALTVGVSSSVNPIPPTSAANPGTVWVNTINPNGIDSISVLIGTIQFFGGVDSTTYTVTANAGEYDYSTLGAEEEAFLEAADGARLFFSDTTNGSDLGDAGSIVVASIPESSTSLLVSFLSIALLGQRRRSRG